METPHRPRCPLSLLTEVQNLNINKSHCRRSGPEPFFVPGQQHSRFLRRISTTVFSDKSQSSGPKQRGPTEFDRSFPKTYYISVTLTPSLHLFSSLPPHQTYIMISLFRPVFLFRSSRTSLSFEPLVILIVGNRPKCHRQTALKDYGPMACDSDLICWTALVHLQETMLSLP
ncbi:hypothetical protein AVEN_253609-1 [Araneus ventricosus]|uniref:Uncharacterized protein n=1 Tax=Araneus ventricosus TaxID=182803 RepID=A0A4Y2CBM7_ARAVE|nr:hypothetical protein AVEN_253609-1 [Araneus ventricosus]